jgi:glycine cleavage system transcriptional repressor
MQKVIISVLGPDRPGIIASVSGVLYKSDCNIENISQTILQSEFAGIFIASIPANVTLEALHEKLNQEVAPLNLSIFVKPLATEIVIQEPPIDAEPFVITTIGPDQKGLVARITAILAAYQVNVTNLQAVFKGGQNPTDNVMIYEVDIPLNIDRQALYRHLRAKAANLQLNLTIQHRDIFEAINRI